MGECRHGSPKAKLSSKASMVQRWRLSLDSIYRPRDLRFRRSTKATEHYWVPGSNPGPATNLQGLTAM